MAKYIYFLLLYTVRKKEHKEEHITRTVASTNQHFYLIYP